MHSTQEQTVNSLDQFLRLDLEVYLIHQINLKRTHSNVISNQKWIAMTLQILRLSMNQLTLMRDSLTNQHSHHTKFNSQKIIQFPVGSYLTPQLPRPIIFYSDYPHSTDQTQTNLERKS